MNIAFRVDANKKIGGGHFQRCLNFAKIIKNKNRDIYFISRNLNKNLKRKLHNQRIELINFKSKKEYEIFEILKKNKIDDLVIDHYSIKKNLEKKIKNRVKKLIVFDDKLIKHFGHLIINNNFLNKNKIQKFKNINSESKVFAGAEFFFNNFYTSKNFYLKKNNRLEIRNLFIFFGLSDPENSTLKVLKAICNLNKIKIHVVVGNFNSDIEEIKSLCSKKAHLKYYENISNEKVMKIMLKCDLAIGSGGVNLIERVIMCLPSIVISNIKNQRSNLDYLSCKKVIIKTNIKNLNKFFFNSLLDKKNLFLKKKFFYLFNNTFQMSKFLLLKNKKFINKINRLI
jgi:UDP-2,4-diacetamido-2,4,6-trideoxy-beta-L-altropyranose hydrolase